jgi:hypothetical protein
MRYGWMICCGLLIVAVFTLPGCAHSGQGRVEVARSGQAMMTIVTPRDASPAVQHGAEELALFLGEMTGATFEIVSDESEARSGEIILGAGNKRLETLGVEIGLTDLGPEGYVLRGAGPNLVIAGGEPRGTLYGVYGLLEDHLDCRWFTPDVRRIPKRENLVLPRLKETVRPRLEYREPFVLDGRDPDWCARNRMNSSAAALEEKHGGKVAYFGFVHTFYALLPPDEYFDEHPEYFSLVNGERLKEHAQLCATNDDVIRLVTEAVRARMREHPEAMVFSVSQNDHFNYCECDRCTAMADGEGSQIGPVLYLVNRVARAVADEFPDKAIDTLAYQYTRKPPKTMRPEPNVIIRLCSIECCFSHSFTECDSEENRAFVEDVKGWSTVSDRLWVWDYVTSFSHYLTPFPNLNVRKDNINFLADHNVTGIFEQDAYTTLHGELSPLSAYLNAKLLWNPDYNDQKAINEFLAAVYGPAEKPIRAYIDLIHDKVEKENIHMDIWIGPDHGHLDDALLEEAAQLWDQAEAAVTGDVLDRVRAARLSVDYATLERFRAQRNRMFTLDHENFTATANPEAVAVRQRFFEVIEQCGFSSFREQNGSVDVLKEYYRVFDDNLQFEIMPAIAANADTPGLQAKYYEGGWMLLPDFDALTPAREAVVREISLETFDDKADAFALRFSGYLNAPKDGIYTFALHSNDGSKLYLDGKEIINHDGAHRALTESGMAALKQGLHAIQVDYFQAGGGMALALQWAGPDFEMRAAAGDDLRH